MTATGHKSTANAIVDQIARRREHTREIVKHDLAPDAARAMVRMAHELDATKDRLARIERALAALATEAARDDT